MSKKGTRYKELVEDRKGFDPSRWGLTNPASIEGGKFDREHIGPWTLWAHDLDADLMVLVQLTDRRN